MPELTAAQVFTDHWATCDWCQEGLPCAAGDPLYAAMAREVADMDNDPAVRVDGSHYA